MCEPQFWAPETEVWGDKIVCGDQMAIAFIRQAVHHPQAEHIDVVQTEAALFPLDRGNFSSLHVQTHNAG